MARIALGAVEKYPDLDLHVVPVGLNYSNHMGFRSEVWIDYGNPVSVQKVIKENSGSGERINVLTSQVEAELRTMVLHLEKEGYEESDKAMRRNMRALKPLSGKELVEIEKLKIKSEKPKEKSPQWIFDILSFPLLIIHRPLYFIVDKLAEKLTGRDEFFPSVKYGMCTLFFPIYWIVLSIVLAKILGLPLLAAFALWFLFPVSLWVGLKIKKV